ncbi:MAG: hypothetical protein MAG458_01146 [Nitrosopumilus sp.]|nr:hypothetical protein [Nitrosopumilus sp.]
MKVGYVLITCENDLEDNIIGKLKSIKQVTAVHKVLGMYNVIVDIRTDDIESLRDVIVWKIKKIDGITSTISLISHTSDASIRENILQHAN